MTVAWDSKCKRTHRDVQYLDINEETDTKLLLHAVDATASELTSSRQTLMCLYWH